MPDYSPPFLGNVSLNVKGLVEFDLYKSTFSPKEKKNIFSFFALKKSFYFGLSNTGGYQTPTHSPSIIYQITPSFKFVEKKKKVE